MGWTNDPGNPDYDRAQMDPAGALMAAIAWLTSNGLHWGSHEEPDVVGLDTVVVRISDAEPPHDGSIEIVDAAGIHVLQLVYAPPGEVDGTDEGGWMVDVYRGPANADELEIRAALMVYRDGTYTPIHLDGGWD